MDFSDAVIFIAGVIVIVAAGTLLGYGLALRNRKQHDDYKAHIYSELVTTLDGLRTGDDEHKQSFVELYYQALMHGSDDVVRALNNYLQLATAPEDRFDASTLANARDHAVLVMRKDARGEFGLSSKLQTQELYSVEIGGGPHGSEHMDALMEQMKPQSIPEARNVGPKPTPVPGAGESVEPGPKSVPDGAAPAPASAAHPADDVYQR